MKAHQILNLFETERNSELWFELNHYKNFCVMSKNLPLIVVFFEQHKRKISHFKLNSENCKLWLILIFSYVKLFLIDLKEKDDDEVTVKAVV